MIAIVFASPRLRLREIGRFGGIVIQIEEFAAGGFDFVDEFPIAIAQAEEAEGVVGEEEAHSFVAQGGAALPCFWWIEAEQIADGAGDVDEADGATDWSA